MEEYPKVSVIIPTHKRALMLSRAINSVLLQTYKNFELIIVSDGKDKNTDKIVSSYGDFRIKYLKHVKSRGASAARNTGIRASKGKYIAFLDDDDEWVFNKLEKQVLLMEDSSDGIGLVYCWMEYFRNEKSIKVLKPNLRGYIFSHMLDKQAIGNSSTIIIKSEVIKKVGCFDENLPRGNDSDFIRRICFYYNVEYIPEVLVKVYIGHKSPRITSSDKKGIINAIIGEKAKLIKFKSELHKYPRQVSSIYSKIAFHYSQIGEWRNSFINYLKASKICPTNFLIYKKIIKSIPYFFKNDNRKMIN